MHSHPRELVREGGQGGQGFGWEIDLFDVKSAVGGATVFVDEGEFGTAVEEGGVRGCGLEPDEIARGHVHDGNPSIIAPGEPKVIRAEGERIGRPRSWAWVDQFTFIGSVLVPQVAPFPATEIVLIRGGGLIIEEPLGFAEVASLERLESETDFGAVGGFASELCLGVGLLPEIGLGSFSGARPSFAHLSGDTRGFCVSSGEIGNAELPRGGDDPDE